MIVYAESSAVLSWLFGESRSKAVREVLDRATVVVTSRITGIECARAIVRCEALGTITPAQANTLRELYDDAAAAWDVMEIDPRVAALAGEAFPVEPIRALDAMHVATAALAEERFRAVTMLSLDDRVRSNAAALGLTVVPKTA